MTELTINTDVTMGGTGGSLLANRFRVLRQLGQGGMGSVWLAEDSELNNRQVAIKMLPSILLSNKRAYNQIRTEALLSLKLTHPNIATLRSFEENKGNPFLVIDYIEGQTLDDYLADKSKLSESETIELLRPIADALDYAHSKGVVHRDIKPGNVMISVDRTPYILDFGVAREMQETLTRVTGRNSSGTLMYMSPEQLHGAAPSVAQDVYSFAAMAYECIVGTPPFSRGQIEYQIEHDTPIPLPEHIGIARNIEAGLAKDCAKRPCNCAHVLGGEVVKPNAESMQVSISGQEPSIDSEYERTQAEIRRYEAILAQREAEKRAKLEANKKQKELREAKERLQQLRRQAGEFGCEDNEAGASRVVKLKCFDNLEFELVYCPPGSFIMSSGSRFNQNNRDEPAHNVILTRGFWIGRYPVTQRQWKVIMGNEGGGFLGLGRKSRFAGDDRPMENVTWDESVEFTRRISGDVPGKFRLPTEAEWEYACRAGNEGNVPGSEIADSSAWYARNSGGCTHPIGKRSPNAWGIHDMHGNVWEWCADWFAPYTAEDQDDPKGPRTGVSKVLRGGGWGSKLEFCQCVSRISNRPGNKGADIGFRICIDA